MKNRIWLVIAGASLAGCVTTTYEEPPAQTPRQIAPAAVAAPKAGPGAKKVEQKAMSLDDVVTYLAQIVADRAADGNNFGVCLVPEGLIELEVCTLSGGLLTPECQGHRIKGYYYPGTEPTEPCKKHSDKTASTIGISRLDDARWRSGFTFDFIDDSELSVNLDFLKSNKLSSELKQDNFMENDFSEDEQDYLSNWLFD